MVCTIMIILIFQMRKLAHRKCKQCPKVIRKTKISDSGKSQS